MSVIFRSALVLFKLWLSGKLSYDSHKIILLYLISGLLLLPGKSKRPVKVTAAISARYQLLQQANRQERRNSIFQHDSDDLDEEICPKSCQNYKSGLIFVILLFLGFVMYLPFFPFSSNRRKCIKSISKWAAPYIYYFLTSLHYLRDLQCYKKVKIYGNWQVLVQKVTFSFGPWSLLKSKSSTHRGFQWSIDRYV